MALRYWLEYNDVENVTHRVEIEDTDFNGSATEINGSVFLDYGSVDKSLECFRGSGLRIDLEASKDRKFTELFTGSERQFKVTYERDSETLFIGYINPEGYFEDYVSDHWIVSVDCIDGLSLLTNLSYVDNSGLPFNGKQKQLDIIVNCLKRIGLNLNINTSIEIYYTGLSGLLNVLDNVYAQTERFYKDDGDTIMSCEEVLKDTLEGYAACITLHDGEWYIYRPNQIWLETEQEFFRYDSDGVALSPATKDVELRQLLGSQIDDFYPHHANANQQLSLDKAIGAYRINYTYGFVKSLIDNVFLQNIGGTIDDWTIDGGADLTLPGSGEYGVYLPYRYVDNDNTFLEMTSDNIAVGNGDIINVGFDVSPDPSQEYLVFFTYRLKVVNGGTTYYYNDTTNTWQLTTPHPCGVDVGLEAVQFTITLPATPQSGDFSVEIIKPVASNSLQTATDRDLYLTKCTVEPDTNANVKGEIHTFERTTDPSSKIEDNKEVFTGDNPTEIYVGALFENDEITPTTIWRRNGEFDDVPLIRIMGEDTMRMNQDNSFLFIGDIYGYMPYFSVVTINNIPGLFMFIEYSYDTKSNLISGKLKQIFGEELDDIDYRVILDYGNVVRPTIKG